VEDATTPSSDETETKTIADEDQTRLRERQQGLDWRDGEDIWAWQTAHTARPAQGRWRQKGQDRNGRTSVVKVLRGLHSW